MSPHTGADDRTVQAAGGVLWRRAEERVVVAVVHRPKYDDWSLPKGKLDPGEPMVAGAVREICEETGFHAVPGRTLGESRYRVLDRGRDAPKLVRWWAMRAGDGEFVPGAEVDRLDWLPVEQAVQRVTAGRDAEPLRRFALHPPELALVLLVRHASAGSHSTWAGADDDRPLDERGVAQVAPLTDLLAVYQPQQVLSAPPRRCLDTVAPLAARLGLAVDLDPDLSERRADRLPARLRALGRDGTVVACSQGGTMPAAIDELAGKTGLAPLDLGTPKATVWALSFSAAGDGDSTLVDADRTLPH